MATSEMRKVLVAVDGSAQADQAVAYAAKMLDPQRHQVVLYHVYRGGSDAILAMHGDIGLYPRELTTIDQMREEEKKLILEFMNQNKKQLTDAGFAPDAVQVVLHQRERGLARDLLAEAAKGYAAVVVGRTGLSRLKDLVLGSVSTKLLSKLTKIPLWIVGGAPSGSKLLMAVDNSEWAARCAEHVIAMAPRKDLEITLFHVIRNLEHGAIYAKQIVAEETMAALAKEIKDNMDKVFSQTRQILVQGGFDPAKVKGKMVTEAVSRAGAIVEEAENHGYGTIVVGRRGISQVEEFFIGRVSNKVVSFAKKQAIWVVS